MDEFQNNNFSQGTNQPNNAGQPVYSQPVAQPQPNAQGSYQQPNVQGSYQQPGVQGGYQQPYQGQPAGAPNNGNYYYRQQPNDLNQPYAGGSGNAPYTPSPYAPQQVPEEISMWKYLGMMWIMALPIVGLVLMIIWAFSNDGINRRNYARAVLLNIIITLFLTMILWGAVAALVLQIMRTLPDYAY